MQKSEKDRLVVVSPRSYFEILFVREFSKTDRDSMPVQTFYRDNSTLSWKGSLIPLIQPNDFRR